MIPFFPYIHFNNGEGFTLTKTYKYFPKNIFLLKNHLESLTDEDLECRFGMVIGKNKNAIINLALKSYDSSTWFTLQKITTGEIVSIATVHDGELSFSTLPKYRNRGLTTFLIQTSINNIGKNKLYIGYYRKNLAAKSIANKFDLKTVILD